MSKYTYDEVKDLAVLPDDVNETAEGYAKNFNSPGLMVALYKMRKKEVTNGYGEVTHLGNSGRPDVVFKFEKGICKHASPLMWIDKETVIKGSIPFYMAKGK